MMDPQERIRSFARKAHEAEAKAAQAASAALRQEWEDVARTWRLLARQMRFPERKSVSSAD
jgi:hypothetical protein